MKCEPSMFIKLLSEDENKFITACAKAEVDTLDELGLIIHTPPGKLKLEFPKP
jgi:hypothetical protein